MIRILLTLSLLLSISNAKEIYATFTVEPLKDAKLAFISSGIVDSLKVDIGSSVKKDEILAKLDNSDIKAMLDIAKTTLKYAKKDYERQLKIKSLIDEGKFDAISYKYENAKNQLAYQKALYDKTFLKAPFDGIIYAKDVEIGDGVSGMVLKTVFKIQSKTQRKLLVEFDQKNYQLIKVGNTFKYKVDGNEKTYSGTIVKIYPRVNQKNRKITAEIRAKGFLSGLFGDGYISTIEKK